MEEDGVVTPVDSLSFRFLLRSDTLGITQPGRQKRRDLYEGDNDDDDDDDDANTFSKGSYVRFVGETTSDK